METKFERTKLFLFGRKTQHAEKNNLEKLRVDVDAHDLR
jgi:hypothetical protein